MSRYSQASTLPYEYDSGPSEARFRSVVRKVHCDCSSHKRERARSRSRSRSRSSSHKTEARPRGNTQFDEGNLIDSVVEKVSDRFSSLLKGIMESKAAPDQDKKLNAIMTKQNAQDLFVQATELKGVGPKAQFLMSAKIKMYMTEALHHIESGKSERTTASLDKAMEIADIRLDVCKRADSIAL
jgi:hypothetical protein